MKSSAHLKHNMPILEDVLAGIAFLITKDDGESPVIRLDAVGKHDVGAVLRNKAVKNEADAHAGEHGEQHQVREVAEVPDVAGEVSDQSEFEKQRGEAQKEKQQALTRKWCVVMMGCHEIS